MVAQFKPLKESHESHLFSFGVSQINTELRLMLITENIVIFQYPEVVHDLLFIFDVLELGDHSFEAAYLCGFWWMLGQPRSV